jgi:hypothetical protein
LPDDALKKGRFRYFVDHLKSPNFGILCERANPLSGAQHNATSAHATNRISRLVSGKHSSLNNCPALRFDAGSASYFN